MKTILEDFDEAYNKAFSKGDADGCAAFFTDDVMLLPPGEPMIRGKEAFIASYRSRIGRNAGGTHRNALVDFGVDGNLAYQIGTFSVEDSATPERGKFVNILKRQPDGSWKVSVSIFNSDTP
ncbi:MAG: nuclear transport factor 2 family protein [Pseudomonadota bacterium]